MILAAGLGTRLRPLTDYRAKPALPVRGVPVIATLLEFLAHHGIHEVIINLHHLPQTIRDAVAAWTPEGTHVVFSEEDRPLGTGGGIRQARSFLMESDHSVVLAGDMLLDFDLSDVISRHTAKQDLATLVLLEDSRVERFGSIGISKGGAVRRIASSLDLGGEAAAGLFTGVRVFSREALEAFPERDDFEDVRDWMLPELEADNERIRGELLGAPGCMWEPVGTPDEYLRVNFAPPPLSYLDLDARARNAGVQFDGDNVLCRGAKIENGARLDHCVVFEDEHVPARVRASHSAFVAGRVHELQEPHPA
jgi:NDP-sugar pyrophosphorylase family protein